MCLLHVCAWFPGAGRGGDASPTVASLRTSLRTWKSEIVDEAVQKLPRLLDSVVHARGAGTACANCVLVDRVRVTSLAVLRGKVEGSVSDQTIFFFWEREKWMKVSARNSRAMKNNVYRSAPRTSHREGTSPSAPGGTRPRRDSAKELATTQPNIELHWRIQAAAAVPLRGGGTPRTLADTRPRRN